MDQNGLTHTCTTEQSDLTTLCVGLDEVDDLDTGIQHFRGRAQIFKSGWLGVDRATILFAYSRKSVDWITGHVEETAFDAFSSGHGNCLTGIDHGRTANQTFGPVHRNGTHAVLSQVLLYFQYQRIAILFFQFQRVEDLREFAVELNVDNRTDHLFDFTEVCHFSGYFFSGPQACLFPAAKVRAKGRKLKSGGVKIGSVENC